MQEETTVHVVTGRCPVGNLGGTIADRECLAVEALAPPI